MRLVNIQIIFDVTSPLCKGCGYRSRLRRTKARCDQRDPSGSLGDNIELTVLRLAQMKLLLDQAKVHSGVGFTFAW